jgi:quinol monooxygenase YgiN
MSIIVAGTYRVPPENLAALRPHMQTVIAATRAEAGCVSYAYAEDIGEPGLIRVFEEWTDQAALDAHFVSAHMKAWQEVRAGYGLYDRNISVYEIAGQRKV